MNTILQQLTVEGLSINIDIHQLICVHISSTVDALKLIYLPTYRNLFTFIIKWK